MPLQNPDLGSESPKPSKSETQKTKALRKEMPPPNPIIPRPAAGPGRDSSVMSAFLGLTKGFEEALLCRVVLRSPT